MSCRVALAGCRTDQVSYRILDCACDAVRFIFVDRSKTVGIKEMTVPTAVRLQAKRGQCGGFVCLYDRLQRCGVVCVFSTQPSHIV